MTIGNRAPGDGGIGNRGVVRADGRTPADLRPIEITLGVQKWAEGSALIRFGDTQVLCAATIEDRVPPHLRGKGTGWVTATYEMLPRSTAERSERESAKGKVGGRHVRVGFGVPNSVYLEDYDLGGMALTISYSVLQ